VAAVDSELKRYATVYGRAGWPVFLLTPGGKEPLISRSRGGQGFKDATTDLAQIEAWWTKYPNANIGTPTGLVIDVLDVDVRTKGNGYGWLERLRLAGLVTGAIAEARTRNDGRHLVYPVSGSGCRSFKGKWLDIKARGGYVVLPPSKVAADEGIEGPGEYSWLEFDQQKTQRTPLDVEAISRFLQPPARFNHQKTQKTSDPSKRAAGVVAFVRAAKLGERNNSLYWAAMKLAEDDLLDRYENDLIRAVVNHGAGDDGFSEYAAKSTIGSARRWVRSQ
jgi:hypothetical protein